MNDTLEALNKVLSTLFQFLGPNVTLGIIIAAPILLFLYKIYTDWRKAREVNLAIQAKDETIQILNEHNRQLSVIELKLLGWNDSAIEAVVMKETPKDAIEAREMIQKSKLEKKNRTSK